MSEQTFTIDNRTYISLPSCSVGDYSGAGTVGRANINAIRKEYMCVDVNTDILRQEESYFFDREAQLVRDEEFPPLVCVNGMYSYERLFMLDDHPNFNNLYDSLESYAVFDEDEYSRQEQDDKESSWDSWIESDFLDTVKEAFDDEEEYKAWEARYYEHRFGLFQVERWINDSFNMYIEEDGYQCYRMDFKRLLRELNRIDDLVSVMNEFIDDFS
jgi:hypothetical protein